MKTNNIFRDNIWQFISTIVAAIGILVAAFVAYNIFYLQRDVKSLQVVILANASLVEVDPTVAQDIEVLYKGQPASNLSLIQIKLENNGNQAIRVDDYERPIRFVFPPEAQIVKAEIIDSNPRNIGMDISIQQNAAILSPVLLNENDRVIASFLLINTKTIKDVQPFTLDYRLVNVQEVPVVNAIEDKTTTTLLQPDFINDLLAGLLSILGIFMLTGFILSLIFGRTKFWAMFQERLRETSILEDETLAPSDQKPEVEPTPMKKNKNGS